MEKLSDRLRIITQNGGWLRPAEGYRTGVLLLLMIEQAQTHGRDSTPPLRSVATRRAALVGVFLMVAVVCAPAGTIIVTGHDPDFHVQSTIENSQGAANLISHFVGAANSRNGKVLFVTDGAGATGDPSSGCAGPCTFDSLAGIRSVLGSA